MSALRVLLLTAAVLAPWGVWLAAGRARRAAWTVVLPLALMASVAFVRGGILVAERGRSAWHFSPGFVEAQWRLPSGDVDVNVLVGGLRAAPRLRDTAKWWTGRWVGQNEFWRPASSYLFWLEWRAFGPSGRGWAAVSVLLAVSLAGVALWALSPLLGEGGAAVAVLAAFVGLWTPWERWTPMVDVIGLWKNQPDLLAGLGILAGVGWAVRGRLGYAAAAGCFAVACKELGFTTFLLVPLALAWRERVQGVGCDWRRAGWCCVLPAAALLLWHFHTVGFGHRIGANVHWPLRAFLYYGGLPAGLWRLGVPWVVFLGAGCLLWLPFFLKRPLPALAAAIAAVSLTAAALAWRIEAPFEVALTWVFMCWHEVLAMAVWAWLARLGCRRQAPVLLLGVAWMLIGAAPTFAATQVLSHARWLGSLGQGIVAAGVVAAVCEWGLEGIAALRCRQKRAREQGPGERA